MAELEGTASAHSCGLRFPHSLLLAHLIGALLPTPSSCYHEVKATHPTGRLWPQGWHGSHISHPKHSTAWSGCPLYSELVEEALEVCKQHLSVLQHQDIDRRTPSPCRTCIDWDHFLQEYYRVAQ